MLNLSKNDNNYRTNRLDSQAINDLSKIVKLSSVLDSDTSTVRVRTTDNVVRYLSGSATLNAIINVGDTIANLPKAYLPRFQTSAVVALNTMANSFSPFIITLKTDGTIVAQTGSAANRVINFDNVTYFTA